MKETRMVNVLSPEASVDRVELLLSHSFLPSDSELLLFAFVKTRTIPFLCFCLLFINTVLTLSCSPDFFCLLFSVVLWFVLVQLVASTSTACVFLSARHPICFFVTKRFLPTSLHCISENWGQLWNIFNIDNRLESSQMWINLQKLVAWADLPGKVGRD